MSSEWDFRDRERKGDRMGKIDKLFYGETKMYFWNPSKAVFWGLHKVVITITQI